MPSVERVTVTLPDNLLREIDRLERNRSKFVVDAVRRELDRRRREELRRSLHQPHSESMELADSGIEEWARGLPPEDASTLVDFRAGKAVRWRPTEGWVEEGE